MDLLRSNFHWDSSQRINLRGLSLSILILLLLHRLLSYCRLMIFSCKLDFRPEEEGGVNLHFRRISWSNKFANNFTVFHFTCCIIIRVISIFLSHLIVELQRKESREWWFKGDRSRRNPWIWSAGWLEIVWDKKRGLKLILLWEEDHFPASEWQVPSQRG